MEGNIAWRIPTILQVLIPVLSLPGLIWAPESPRWLISNDRVEEARVLLEKWHADGDKNSALVNYEMMEITETLRAERDAHDSASYAEMFKTPGNRHRLFISVSLGIFVQWCKCIMHDLYFFLRTLLILLAQNNSRQRSRQLLFSSRSRDRRSTQCHRSDTHIGVPQCLEPSVLCRRSVLRRQTWSKASLPGICSDYVGRIYPCHCIVGCVRRWRR
jgi:hypothetical protein